MNLKKRNISSGYTSFLPGLMVATLLLFCLGSFAQTTIYEYGFESSGESFTAPTWSVTIGTGQTLNSTFSANSGSRHARIEDAGGGSKEIDASLITPQISFTSGRYYVITAHVYTNGNDSKLSVYKNTNNTNGDMTSSIGSDIINAPGSNNCVLLQYQELSASFVAGAT